MWKLILIPEIGIFTDSEIVKERILSAVGCDKSGLFIVIIVDLGFP